MPSTAFPGCGDLFPYPGAAIFRYGFPGCGFSPYPGRSFLGTAFPGCGDLFPYPGAAISQVRLSWVRRKAVPRSVFPGYGFSWVRRFISALRYGFFPGYGDLPHPGRSFPGYGFSWVRLFLGTAFPGCTAICVVVPRSGFFPGTAFPRSGFFSGERAIA